MPQWEPTLGSRGPTYAGGPSWHEKWAPGGGYVTPGEDPEPYEHWKHTWHLHPGLEETGQVRTTAPVVESALLARPWEVAELRYVAEQGPAGWRSTYEGVSEYTEDPYKFEVDDEGKLRCLACCATASGFCGSPLHTRRRADTRDPKERGFANGTRVQPGLGSRPAVRRGEEQPAPLRVVGRRPPVWGEEGGPARPRGTTALDPDIDPRLLNRLDAEAAAARARGVGQLDATAEGYDPRLFNRLEAPASSYVLPISPSVALPSLVHPSAPAVHAPATFRVGPNGAPVYDDDEDEAEGVEYAGGDPAPYYAPYVEQHQPHAAAAHGRSRW